MGFGDGQAGKPLLERAAEGSTVTLGDVPDGDAVRPALACCVPLEPAAAADCRSDLAAPADMPCADLAGGGSVRLAATEENVPHGRRWLREQLGTRFGHDHSAVADALQAFSEVLTNAVMHGSGCHVRIAWKPVKQGVIVEVYNGFDEGGSLPASQGPADTYAESGRGLSLVGTYSDAWGTERTPGNGIRVWFSVRFG